MVYKPIECPTCGGQSVVKHGKTETNKQRYFCQNPKCSRQTFVTDNAYKGRLAETKTQIVSMSLNGSGIRDIARVLEISPATVISEIKKKQNTFTK